ncbi:unnamed protein product [Choristocarpus tenellus]
MVATTQLPWKCHLAINLVVPSATQSYYTPVGKLPCFSSPQLQPQTCQGRLGNFPNNSSPARLAFFFPSNTNTLGSHLSPKHAPGPASRICRLHAFALILSHPFCTTRSSLYNRT